LACFCCESWAADQGHASEWLGLDRVLGAERLYLVRVASATARHPVNADDWSGAAEAAPNRVERSVNALDFLECTEALSVP